MVRGAEFNVMPRNKKGAKNNIKGSVCQAAMRKKVFMR